MIIEFESNRTLAPQLFVVPNPEELILPQRGICFVCSDCFECKLCSVFLTSVVARSTFYRCGVLNKDILMILPIGCALNP